VRNGQSIGSFYTQFTRNKPIPETTIKECTMVFRPGLKTIVHPFIVFSGIG
jgi:hypothetical protein